MTLSWSLWLKHITAAAAAAAAAAADYMMTYKPNKLGQADLIFGMCSVG